MPSGNHLNREEKERDESESPPASSSSDATQLLNARLIDLEAELAKSREAENDALEKLDLVTEERARLEEELAGAQVGG